MRFDDAVGVVEVSTQQAIYHLTSWFSRDDLVCIVGIRDRRGTGKNVLSQVVPVSQFVEELNGPNGNALLEGLCLGEDGSQWNVYIVVSAADHELTSITKREGYGNVSSMPGVWGDFDVKNGSFASQDDILSYLRTSMPEPSLVVATGSGGVHSYWKCPMPLSLIQAREVQRRWWAFLKSEAENVEIDQLVDPTRLLRLAGTIRWPKEGEDAKPAQVKIIHANREKTYSLETLYSLSNDAWATHSTKLQKTRVQDMQLRAETDELLKLAAEGNGEWATYAAIGMAEELFNETVSWDEILEPSGWTFLREDSQGRREWARPGREEKSATTDWPESPDIMSLLSWSETTGLADLKEAGIALSKYRVGLRLWFDDDVKQMTQWVLANAH